LPEDPGFLGSLPAIFVLLAASPEKLREPVSHVERAEKEYNMLINAAKIRVMRKHPRSA